MRRIAIAILVALTALSGTAAAWADASPSTVVGTEVEAP